MDQELGYAQGYVEMDENHCLQEAQWGTGKGKGNSTNLQHIFLLISRISWAGTTQKTILKLD